MTDTIITYSWKTKLKAISGNDMKILVAMFLLGAVNIGNKALKNATGLSYPTVASCLENLADESLVTKTSLRTGAWQITEGGFQLLLPDPSTNFLHSESIINIDNPLNTRILKDSNNNNTQPSERIFDSPPDPEILKALHGMGIYDPTAVGMARLDHITQDYISSWGSALEAGLVGKGGKDIPLAIHIMGQGGPAPIPAPTEEEARKKYISGKFSDLIEH